jgi:hypothetical protein
LSFIEPTSCSVGCASVGNEGLPVRCRATKQGSGSITVGQIS